MSEYPPLHRKAVQREREELQKDYIAFCSALDIIRNRIMESQESDRSEPPLHRWSGARATCGSLELSIQIIQRNIEEHNHALDLLSQGVIVDLDAPPPLAVLEGGRHDE